MDTIEADRARLVRSGIGVACRTYSGAADGLDERYREWHFFRTFISNVEMTLAKADMEIASLYVQALVPAELHHLFDRIRFEHDLTVAEVIKVTGNAELLDDQPELKRTLAIREPYLTPISYLQVDLLGRIRAAESAGEVDSDLRPAMLFTINGVAAGMRNTG